MKSVEFIRRFLMHVLPKGFVKMRYYGLLANRVKTPKLSHCRKLTKSPSYQPIYEGLTYTEVLSAILGKDITLCPNCKKAHLQAVLPGDSSWNHQTVYLWNCLLIGEGESLFNTNYYPYKGRDSILKEDQRRKKKLKPNDWIPISQEPRLHSSLAIKNFAQIELPPKNSKGTTR